MPGLLKLKQWLTLADAARHLSLLLEEEVSEADVLRFALDGHLTLSALFVNHAPASCGRILTVEERNAYLADRGISPELYDGILSAGLSLGIGDGRLLVADDRVVELEGVWYLLMVGSERYDVENRYHDLTGGPAVTLGNLTNTLVRREGVVCRLLQHFHDDSARHGNPRDFYPARHLPEDSVLVVRVAALRELEGRLQEAERPIERPLEQRERDNLLVIIAALANLAKLDLRSPSKAAAAIESETERMGVRVSEGTIRGQLKRISEALERK